MLQCPQCTKPLRDLARRCPSCLADLDLLVDYVNHLHTGLERAEHLTRTGELGGAVWAYLEVLEVDPDNSTARKQVADVARAVRQFDLVSPGRRWVNNLPPLQTKAVAPNWLWWVLAATLVVLAFSTGVVVGRLSLDLGGPVDDVPPEMQQKQDRLN